MTSSSLTYRNRIRASHEQHKQPTTYTGVPWNSLRLGVYFMSFLKKETYYDGSSYLVRTRLFCSHLMAAHVPGEPEPILLQSANFYAVLRNIRKRKYIKPVGTILYTNNDIHLNFESDSPFDLILQGD